MRTVAAIVIAPLAVIPILTLAFGPWALAHGGTRALAGILVPGVVVAYVLLIVVGLPMHLVLRRQLNARPRAYAITGALLGAVPVIGYVLVAIVFEARFSPSAMPRAIARNAHWGAIGVLVFGSCSSAVAAAFRAVAGVRTTAT